MSKNKQPANQGRRQFMRGSAIAGAGTVIAAGMSGVATAGDIVAEVEDKPVEEGYRVTQHILDYYKSAAS